MRKAVVETATGKVVNVIEVGIVAFDPGPGRELVHGGNIGDTWDGAGFTPAPPEASVMSPRAKFKAEVQAATTIEELKAAILSGGFF